VAQVVLKRPGVAPVVGQLVAAGVAEHVEGFAYNIDLAKARIHVN
jgi:hypothetical protein